VTDPRVLRYVVEAIAPASAAHGEAARRRVAAAHAPLLDRLAVALGRAQHTAQPHARDRAIAVCAGDHGAGDPGIAVGAAHPPVIAAHEIASGEAALVHVARTGRASIVLIDAGAREAAAMPPTTVVLGGRPSRDLMAGPAMTLDDAAAALESGIALAVSLTEHGRDLLAVGALGVGAERAAAALLGAALGDVPAGLGDAGAQAAAARGAAFASAAALDQLAAFGGPETCVLAGLMLAAAAGHVPVILDGYATAAAALAAAAFAPHVTGYLIAAHAGSLLQPRILAHLGLHPIFDVGLGHGEGTGAAMILPLIDQVTALAGRG